MRPFPRPAQGHNRLRGGSRPQPNGSTGPVEILRDGEPAGQDDGPIELHPVDVARVNFGPTRSAARLGSGLERIAVEEIDPEPARGRRPRGRRVRLELVALALGAAFTLAALIKPWGGRPPATPRPTPGPVASTVIAHATLGPPVASSSPETPPLFDVAPGVAGVDWRPLVNGDGHREWGLAAAKLPLSTVSGGSAAASSPSIGWLAYPPTAWSSPLELGAGLGGSVVAVALTWPKDVQPVSVKFEYLGPTTWDGPGEASTDGSATFMPVPASLVAEGPGSMTYVDGIPSGTFWLPPSTLSGQSRVVNGVVPHQRWRAELVPWPSGRYTIVMDLASGPPIFLSMTLA